MAFKALDPGTRATYDLTFLDTVTGTPVSSADIAPPRGNGTRTLRIYDGNGNYAAWMNRVQDAGARISIWVYLNALGDSGDGSLLEVNTSDWTSSYTLKVDSTGLLTLYAYNSNRTLGTAGYIQAGQWTRFCLSYVIASSSYHSVRLYKSIGAGSSMIAEHIGAGDQSTGSAHFRVYSHWGGRVTYFSDLVIDDETDLADIAPAGQDVYCAAKLPIAHNVNQFSDYIGNNPANRWENVNERARNSANGWRQATGSQTRENYTLQAAGVGDEDLTGLTVIGRDAWLIAKAGADGKEAGLTDNGNDSSITLNSTEALFHHYVASAAYPSNAAGIGIESTFDTAVTTDLYECGTVVAYLSEPPVSGIQITPGTCRRVSPSA